MEKVNCSTVPEKKTRRGLTPDFEYLSAFNLKEIKSGGKAAMFLRCGEE